MPNIPPYAIIDETNKKLVQRYDGGYGAKLSKLAKDLSKSLNVSISIVNLTNSKAIPDWLLPQVAEEIRQYRIECAKYDIKSLNKQISALSNKLADTQKCLDDLLTQSPES